MQGMSPQRYQRLLAKFDFNRDGKLDQKEMQAAKQARQQRILAKFDKNKNGKLDPDELKAFQQFRQQRRAQRQHAMQQQFTA